MTQGLRQLPRNMNYIYVHVLAFTFTLAFGAQMCCFFFQYVRCFQYAVFQYVLCFQYEARKFLYKKCRSLCFSMECLIMFELHYRGVSS